MNAHNLFIKGNGGVDTNGVFFDQTAWFPIGINVLPYRVFWEYGAGNIGHLIRRPVAAAWAAARVVMHGIL